MTRRDRYAVLLDTARDAIFVYEADLSVSYWNEGATELYGWTTDEAVGQSVRDLLHPDSGAFDRAAAIARVEGQWSGVLDQITRSGRRFLAEGRWKALPGEEGRAAAVLSVVSETSERQKHVDEALRALRREDLETLAGELSAELNNAMTPVLLGSQLLAVGEMSAARRQVLEDIELSAERGADLARRIATLADRMDRLEDERPVG